LVDIDNKREIIFGDDPEFEEIIWHGQQPTVAQLAERTGIEEAQPMAKLYTILREAQASRKDIHFLPPYRFENKIKVQRFLNIKPDQINLNASSVLVRSIVDQREIKSTAEIVEIEKAVNLSLLIHTEILKNVQPGMTEVQIAAKALEIIYAQNCRPAYPIIATIEGNILHNHSRKNILKDGDLFLLDAGVETSEHYAGDLSSSFPVGKTFSPTQKSIYEAGVKAHQTAVDLLRPEVDFLIVHQATCHSIAQSMKDLGLMKGDIDEAVSVGAHALFFPCGTGHLLGLDVHDMEDLGELWVGYNGEAKSNQFGLKSLRLAKKLRPGHVLTIEPGIYFIPQLIDQWKQDGKFDAFLNWEEIEKYRNFGGIRIGENFVITENGNRKLGNYKPMSVNEIELFRN
jgi:Xaa-Pro aminopeptidase